MKARSIITAVVLAAGLAASQTPAMADTRIPKPVFKAVKLDLTKHKPYQAPATVKPTDVWHFYPTIMCSIGSFATDKTGVTPTRTVWSPCKIS